MAEVASCCGDIFVLLIQGNSCDLIGGDMELYTRKSRKKTLNPELPQNGFDK